MIKTDLPIYLASKSPRRRKLLKQLNLNFTSFSVNILEERKEDEDPVQMVRRLSKEKLDKAKKQVGKGIIITADTIVVIENEVLGKPVDRKDASDILNRLSGKTHIVYTGFSVYNSNNLNLITEHEKTLVTFRILEQSEINDYIESGSPMDKAGAYGIQDDFGAVFIDKIEGDYYNVVGLPLAKLYQNLLKVI